MTKTTCPKCHGLKTFKQFRHLAAGKCFLCCGVGEVSKAKAGAWINAQSGMAADLYVAPAQPTTPNPYTKPVRRNLPGVGRVEVCIDRRDGRMTLTCLATARTAYVNQDGSARVACDPTNDWNPRLIAAAIRKAKAAKAAA